MSHLINTFFLGQKSKEIDTDYTGILNDWTSFSGRSARSGFAKKI